MMTKKIADYTKRKPGRPRSEKSHQAILEATRSLMLEVGISGLSIERIAILAGVGKTTIYRRWKSKKELITEAFGSIADQVDIPDTGNVVSDLITVAKGMLDSLHDSFHAPVQQVMKLIVGMMENEDIMVVYRERYLSPRRRAFVHILERGKANGQLRHEADVELIIDMLIGSYFYNALLGDGHLSPELWFEQAAAQLIQGIGTHRSNVSYEIKEE